MLRQVNEENLAECADVIRKSFMTVADEFGFTAENAPRFTAFSTTRDRLCWQLHEERRPMYAEFDGDRIVGYFSLMVQGGECELNNLCVLPEYRHGGLGGELLTSAFEAAKKLGCTKVNIGIVEENKTLRKWYEAYGFIHTGTKKFDFFPFTCGYMYKEL